MSKFYFVKAVFEKNRMRIRPLSGQFLENGKAIDTQQNVSCNQEIRSDYKMGTIFCIEKLEEAMGFLDAKGSTMHVMNMPAAKPEHKPTAEMVRAYEEFTGDPAMADEPKVKAAPVRETFLMKLKSNPKYSVPNIMDGFYVPEELWYLSIRNIKNSINTIFTGPTGTGKTELVQLICKRLGIPCSIFDMGAMQDPIMGLLGIQRLVAGKSVFDAARFTKVLPLAGVTVLDELSRAPASSNNILFPTLDSRRCLPIEIAMGDEDRNIPLHPDHCITATANIGGEYTGTNQLDSALVNRFFQIKLDYMPPNLEIQVLTSRTSIEKSEAMQVAKVAETIRNSYKNNDLSDSISTRETIQIAQCIRDGFSPLQALELCLLPKFQEEDIPTIKSILASK